MTDLRFAPVDPVEDVLSRLAYYRRTAYGVRTDFEAELMEWFGFLPRQARIVAALYTSPCALSREALLRLSDVSQETLRVNLGPIRQALGEGAIPPSDDGRYHLTQLGRAACDEAVANVGIGYLRGRLMCSSAPIAMVAA